jgi:hypothetical protein
MVMSTYFHKNRAACEQTARDVAKADKSDPFAGRRALSLMRNNIALPSDYTFKNIPTEVGMFGQSVIIDKLHLDGEPVA